MNTKQRLRRGLALATAIAATAAPPASARVGEEFLGPQPAQAGGGAPTATKARVVEVPAGTGFDWGDAGIGAGAAFALTAIGLGGALARGSRRQREERAATIR
jgi:hypothetical protein